MPSIKVLNISLVLLCIFITAFVCTFLAITSNDKALDDTKESRDLSVGSCFEFSEVSVTNRTSEYLDLLMVSTMDYLNQFTQQTRVISQGFAKEIMAEPWEDVQKWEWHRPTRYFTPFSLQKANGNSGGGIMLGSKVTILHYDGWQVVDTVPPGLENVEYNKVMFNYGDDHVDGGYNRTWVDTCDSVGMPAFVNNIYTDVDWLDRSRCKTFPTSNGTVDDRPCAAATGFEDPTKSPYWYIGAGIPAGHTLWSSPFVVSASYMTINAFTPIHHNGTYTGIAFSGAHLSHISNHLSTLEIGGPVEGHPSRGRVYVTLRNSWLDPTQAGRLIGASHGSAVMTTDSGPKSRLPVESTDSIISSVANVTMLAGITSADLAGSGNLTTVRIETNLAPEGEDFFYRVGLLQDQYGLDWYVHLVIDREYILGGTDKKTIETRDEIKASETKVDDDLNKARMVLYIVVVGVSVGLTVLSAAFVLRIIKPLLVLKKEMAAVAVMKLEEVNMNRPLSALEEVRMMQVSFLQMIHNLVEYRNYMPASVLQDSSSDGTTQNEMSSNGVPAAVTVSRTSGSSSCEVRALAKVQVAAADLRAKRVTLMVCNIVGFLRVGGPSKMQSCIGSYLAVGLQHLKTTKGIPDSFSGDRLYASWNGTRSCPSHRSAGYQCANEMCFDKALSSKLSIGLACGQVTCGNMGCEGMKKYSYVGSLSSWVHVVERIGRSMECDVAIDSTMNEEVCNKAYTRMLRHVEFTKHSSRVLRVYEAMGLKEVANEEWMYQLEEGANNDPNKAYNASYELFMDGQVEDAIKELDGQEGKDSTRVFALHSDRLRAALENPILCEPLGKREKLFN